SAPLAARAGLHPPVRRAASPRTLIRHTTAMQLLHADVDITTIAAWLGHSQLTTTHGYVEIDLRMKQKALAAMVPLPALSEGSFPKGGLLDWLETLGRPRNYVHSPPPIPPFGSGRSGQLRITRGCT
ncbi:MAG: tyrosine-type recombinase/integrase, partial [Thermoanaerobaculia bacterium]|nr:tyrosine-type recombinase/integrase [Thermoanaerobaculia bacterium]